MNLPTPSNLSQEPAEMGITSASNVVLLTASLSLMTCSEAVGQAIVGHRGASYDAPENTVAAFRLAWEQNADGIEGDFYVTQDQQVVCIHDADTKRTAGRKLDVAKSTLAELRELEYGEWKDKEFKGEPIPTFADVMDCVPAGKLFVIELKTGPEIVMPLKAEIERLKPDLKNLLIIAFRKDTIMAVKRELPLIRTHWLTGYKKDEATGVVHPTREEVAEALKSTGADGLGTQSNRDVVTPEFIAGLKSQGMKEFHVWTVDKPDDARYFMELGAVGITTNRPAFIRAALEAPKP
jgi:glycerophosphoryl diester phosphodiesterase